MHTYMLPKTHRLHIQRDVERVSRAGRPVFAPNMTVRFVANRVGRTRMTVVAGLKVSKRSNQRNRAKRLLREAFRRHRSSVVPGVDLAIYAKPSIIGKTYGVLADELGRTLARANLLARPWVDELGKAIMKQ
ncbi:ribonuclease P protein component [Candidatus Uhrbacteria bacterium]|nr:ribonuclease P protein component [Candidatus Uhrbacteria bacterium]